jgi:DNA-directed RNA polymerase subunit RPC12/RpoP
VFDCKDHDYPGRVATRYRCAACGNLTRFDVTTTRRTRGFHHYNLAGELTVEDEEVLEEKVEAVSCRWCGHGNAVEAVEEADA